MTGGDRSVKGEKVFSVIEVLSLDRVKQRLTELLFGESKHKKNVITTAWI